MKKLFLSLFVVFAATSCTKKIYIPVESHSLGTDTVERFITLRESLASVDSVTTEARGDTVFRTIVRERWRTVASSDSARHARTDTVRILRTVTLEKPVPAKSRFSSLAKNLKIFLAAVCLVLLVWCFCKARRGIAG